MTQLLYRICWLYSYSPRLPLLSLIGGLESMWPCCTVFIRIYLLNLLEMSVSVQFCHMRLILSCMVDSKEYISVYMLTVIMFALSVWISLQTFWWLLSISSPVHTWQSGCVKIYSPSLTAWPISELFSLVAFSQRESTAATRNRISQSLQGLSDLYISEAKWYLT